MRYLSRIIRFFILPLLVVQASAAEQAPQSEIKVTLFGQPCLMQGPLDSTNLKTIHAISPEQLYPLINSEELQKTELLKELKSSIAKLASQPKTPSELDRYRERLSKRLEALAAFANGLELARKEHRTAPLLTATKSYLRSRDSKTFEALARNLNSKEKSANKAELIDKLYDLYSNSIEPDAEEEFHRAIRKLGIKYACSYDEAPASPANGETPNSGASP